MSTWLHEPKPLLGLNVKGKQFTKRCCNDLVVAVVLAEALLTGYADLDHDHNKKYLIVTFGTQRRILAIGGAARMRFCRRFQYSV